jgi:hypothetical protein
MSPSQDRALALAGVPSMAIARRNGARESQALADTSPRVTMTGQEACFATRSATLPRKR